MKHLVLASLIWLGMVFAPSAYAQDVQAAARAARVAGEVVAFAADGVRREIVNGSMIYVADSIVTAADAMARIEFTDGGLIDIGQYTRFELKDYLWDGSSGRIRSRVTKGVFQFVTGAIGRINPQAVDFSTRVATIGIRGTRFGGVVGERSGQFTLLNQPTKPKSAIFVITKQGAVLLDKPGLVTSIAKIDGVPSPAFAGTLSDVDTLVRDIERAGWVLCRGCP